MKLKTTLLCLLLLFLENILFCNELKNNQLKKQAEHINEYVFGQLGLNIELAEYKKMGQLLYQILAADFNKLIIVAKQVNENLKKQQEETNALIAKMQTHNQNIPYELFFKQFCLEQQIKHFQDYITDNEKALPFLQKIRHIISPFLLRIDHSDLTKQILNYITYERENILFNYSNLLTFLAAKKNVSWPKLIDFWDTPELEEKLKKRSKHITEVPQVQFAELILSFALQGLVLAGGELGIQWVDEADKKIYEQYSKQQQEIANSWDVFQKTLQQQQEKTIKKIEDSFSKAQEKLNNEYKQSSALLQEELVYLNQAINLDKPMDRYLEAWINWDRYFATSNMLAPNASCIWHNIFNVFNKSDWQFESDTQSFWQNSLVLMPKPFYWQQAAKEKNIFTNDPATHSIFTEYATGSGSYDIQIECTLINCSYPFFVGILFNRGRWISGDPERVWWYRLLGLYGTQAKSDDKATREIALRFGQQDLIFPPNQKEKITAPFEQINTASKPAINFKLGEQAIKTLEHDPITFIFNVTNRPNDLTISLEKKEIKNDKETRTLLHKTSLTNLDSYIFKFHGIGFMAIGCQAQFKIIKPTALIFSGQQIDQFNKKIKSEITK
ncbi:MAG: hypothetical protein WDZ41_03040 [Candidatus Babeliales bacterium]